MNDVFREALNIISGGVPDRPSSPPEQKNVFPLFQDGSNFDVTDEDFFNDLSEHPELTKAIQGLCILYRDLKATDGSFGADAEKALKVCRVDLEKLFDACKRVWDRG